MGTQTKTIQYRYDSRGNRSALIDHDGGRFTYSYDAVNRITQILNPQGDRTTYSYDNAGRRTLKKLSNGTRASFTYDAAGNLTKLYNLKSTGAVVSSFDYTYDKVGNRTAVLEAGGSRVTWSYDNAYQLTGEHRTGANAYRDTYTYDPAGNRLLKNHDGARTTYAYDAANQLTYSQDVSGRTTFTFDADGNQQVVREPAGNRTTYAWDYENRMTLARLASGIRNTMAYDADGLRVKLEESTGTKKFVWDDQNYLGETDAANDTQVIYTNEPQLYGNLVSQRRGSTSHWYHFDALGSTRELTDSSAVVTDTRLYDAWGNAIATTGSTASPLRWVGNVGYYFDLQTGQYYVRARTYQPMIGRWAAPDVLSTTACYKYSDNRALIAADPSGLITVHYIPGRGEFRDAWNIDNPTLGDFGSTVVGRWRAFSGAFLRPGCPGGCLCETVGIIQIIKTEALPEIYSIWHVDTGDWYFGTEATVCPTVTDSQLYDDPGFLSLRNTLRQVAEFCVACKTGGPEAYIPGQQLYVYACIEWMHEFTRSWRYGTPSVYRSIDGQKVDFKRGSTPAAASPAVIADATGQVIASGVAPDAGKAPTERFERTLTRFGW